MYIESSPGRHNVSCSGLRRLVRVRKEESMCLQLSVEQGPGAQRMSNPPQPIYPVHSASQHHASMRPATRVFSPDPAQPSVNAILICLSRRWAADRRLNLCKDLGRSPSHRLAEWPVHSHGHRPSHACDWWPRRWGAALVGARRYGMYNVEHNDVFIRPQARGAFGGCPAVGRFGSRDVTVHQDFIVPIVLF